MNPTGARAILFGLLLPKRIEAWSGMIISSAEPQLRCKTRRGVFSGTNSVEFYILKAPQ
jgi:hypothetical protein